MIGINRITQFTNSQHTGENVDYDYDNSGQLTDADYTTQADEDYDYDDNGNRLTGYTTGANNRLEDDGTFTYEYDGEGNLIKQTETASGDYRVFEWDHRNRLASVSDYDDTHDLQLKVNYTYDAFDRLIGKQVDADGDTDIDRTEAFVYDGNQIVLRFADDDAAALAAADLTNRYLWGPNVDQLLAEENVTSLGSAGTVDWPLTDHQNTIRDWASYSGGTTTITDHAEYDAFGNRLDAPTVDSIFGWTARYRDADTGLQYNWLRWYDPGIGRWTSEDPIGFAGDPSNIYRYVGNGATIYIDPSGMRKVGRPPQPQPQPVPQPQPGTGTPGSPSNPGSPSTPSTPPGNPPQSPPSSPWWCKIPIIAGPIGAFRCGSEPRECGRGSELTPEYLKQRAEYLRQQRKECPPCPDPPPSTFHPGVPAHGCQYGHYHYFEYHQSPWPECICRLVRRTGCLDQHGNIQGSGGRIGIR